MATLFFLFHSLISFLTNSVEGYHYVHFTDEDSEAPRAWVTLSAPRQ